jgi:hypothetical protein
MKFNFLFTHYVLYSNLKSKKIGETIGATVIMIDNEENTIDLRNKHIFSKDSEKAKEEKKKLKPSVC